MPSCRQVNDILEAQRARGVYVPEKLRRPIGVQVNWLGANFFHFIQVYPYASTVQISQR